MSLEYSFEMVRTEICDNCKYRVVERSTVECLDHALDLIKLESSRSLKQSWNKSDSCEVCGGRKHES